MTIGKAKSSIMLILTLAVVVLGILYTYKSKDSVQTSTANESLASKNNKAIFDKIIFVTIDTLRPDHLKHYGYIRETSPFLSSLIKDSVVFKNAFSASSHTAPSHASMFTALFPYEHQVLRNYDQLKPEVFNLSSMLQSQGYEQAAITAVKFLEGNVGFPQLAPELDLPSAEFSRKTWYRNAEVNIDRTINWLEKKNHPERFFLWLHFYDVHEWDNLRNLPEKYHSFYDQDNADQIVDFVSKEHNIPVSFHGSKEKFFKAMNSYDARLHFVDDQLKRLFSYIDQHDTSKNTLWVITSDHGEGLGSHNYKGHGEFLYQEQLKIPLFFYTRNGSIKPSQINDLVRTVDLLPTLMELTNYKPQEPASFQGLSLVPLLTDGQWQNLSVKYSFAERRPKDDAALRRNWEEGDVFSLHDLSEKFIYHSQSSHEFYDLEKDPFEERNINVGLNQLPENFRNKVQQMQEFYKSGNSTPAEQKLNKEQYEELKTLGYM